MTSDTASAKAAVTATSKRRPADPEPLIERVVFRCILGLAVASVIAVLVLSVVGSAP